MKRGTPRHPKTAALCARLNIPLYQAVGILEMLWHFTAEYAPQGDIGKYEDRWIEASIGFQPHGRRRSGDLIKALLDTHWIDLSPHYRLLVHDWHTHCDDYVRKRLERTKTPFLTGQPVREFLTGQTADNGCLPLPVPMPLPFTHTPKGTAASVQTSSRFLEWVEPWPRVSSPDNACRMYLSVVTPENEAEVFAVRDRYLGSDEVVSRGVVMDPVRFLQEQSKCAWSGKWPKARDSPTKSKSDRVVDMAVKRILEESNVADTSRRLS